MITNNISFGSTYKVSLAAEDMVVAKKDDKLCCYMKKNNIPYSDKFLNSDDIIRKHYGTVTQVTAVAPDSQDVDFETFLANQGIEFEKRTTAEILKPSSLICRIKNHQEGYVPVFVDCEKLENLAKKHRSNFKYTEVAYNKYQKENTDFAIKSGERFNVPKLFINYNGERGTVEDLRNYVNKYGVENLNDGSVEFWQQNVQDGNTNTYYGLKDLGMKKVPVLMDIKSYKNAETLGLLNK